MLTGYVEQMELLATQHCEGKNKIIGTWQINKFRGPDDIQECIFSSRELCSVAAEGGICAEHFFSTMLVFHCPLCTWTQSIKGITSRICQLPFENTNIQSWPLLLGSKSKSGSRLVHYFRVPPPHALCARGIIFVSLDIGFLAKSSSL